MTSNNVCCEKGLNENETTITTTITETLRWGRAIIDIISL